MQKYSLRCSICDTKQSNNSISNIFCDLNCKALLYCDDVSKNKINPIESIKNSINSISLGEGNTPLVKLEKIGEKLGLDKLFAKLEFMSPTGSFKDRGSALVMNVAKNEKVKEFVEDSSGNAGASLSAYAAAANIKAHIFVPDSAGKGKLDQISIFGAELHKISGPRENSTIEAKKFSKKNDIPYISHNLSPYFSEGMKSFAYEIFNELKTIDHIIFPTGNGSLLLGTWRGYKDLSEIHKNKFPKLHVAQSKNIEPIVSKLNNKKWHFDIDKKTLASGISVSNPPRIDEIIQAVRFTKGEGISSTDEEALIWHDILAKEEGIFSEITCAFVFPALEKLIKDKKIKKDETILLPITGSGLKEPIL
ncbi:MAG: pyridoxal-phosphate dependent enzyme [Chloroflexi bacterium]|nr:MAG: pyridoxal-phosphate dependent enzyme [Chloroflexota bacterium]